MRNALIIGAGGQDGRLLTELLRERQYAVRGWVRPGASTRGETGHTAVDLIDRAGVAAAIRASQPDEIYYLAAFHHSAEEAIPLSEAELLRSSFEVHVNGLLNVLHAIKAASPKSRLFYAASSHVFGAASVESYNEQSSFAPNSAYGISKAAGVECCRLARARDGVFAAAGILFNHESSLRRPGFLSQKIVRGAVSARRDRSFRLTLGDLDARVDWGYAPDYVDAMSRILQVPIPDDFVVATGQLHTVREFAEAAFRAVGLDWRDHVQTDSSLMKKQAQVLKGDFRKLNAATGWAPTISFAEMVTKLVHEAETRRSAAEASELAA